MLVIIIMFLQFDVINSRNEIDDLKSLRNDLNMLKKMSVDGVMVDCWWGLVEVKGLKVYDWFGYKNLFEIV